MDGTQIDLFHVLDAYNQAGGTLDNQQLYGTVANMAGVPIDTLNHRAPVGETGQPRSLAKRKIRWHQQTLKNLGVLRRVEGLRGVWEVAKPLDNTDDALHEPLPGVKLVAFSTDLGLALWANNADVFSALDEPISLCVTSPPYPLRTARGYGNPNEREYVDFMLKSLEPIVSNLLPGGSIVLNISNDIFEAKRPSRSLYMERLILALHDDLGLSLMDRIPWVNLSKPPAPTYWACRERVQLCVAWEPVLWFTNDPIRVRSSNRRVLQPHTERHKKLIAHGGTTRTARYGDGAYTLNPGDFGGVTEGRIPKNVIIRGHTCKDTKDLRAIAKEAGHQNHPAVFPTDIPAFAIEFLTEPDELVVDPFAGWIKTGIACERLGRRWLATERVLEYLAAPAQFFRQFSGHKGGSGFL